MAKAKFKPGMVVFWQDPAGKHNPEEDASRYDMIWRINRNTGWIVFGDGTEALPEECRTLTQKELSAYLGEVDTLAYPPL